LPSTSRTSRLLRVALAAPLAALALVAAHTGLTTERALPQAPVGTWVSDLPLLPKNRQEVASAQLGGKVYVGGGTPRSRTANHYRYDPVARRWEQLAPLPTPGASPLDHVAVAALDGKLYYVGGLEQYPAPSVGTVWVYDPATDSFARGADMPRPRGAGALAVHDGTLLYVGGLAGGRAVPWLDAYDPKTDTWRELPSMGTARDHLGLAVVDGRLWAVGGREKDLGATRPVVESYDLAKGVWSQERFAPLPVERAGFAMAAVGEELFVIGGEGVGADGPQAFADVHGYDTATDTWRAYAPLPVTGRHGMQAAQCGSTLYVAGGAHDAYGDFTSPNAGRLNQAFAPGGVVTTRCATGEPEPEPAPGPAPGPDPGPDPEPEPGPDPTGPSPGPTAPVTPAGPLAPAPPPVGGAGTCGSCGSGAPGAGSRPPAAAPAPTRPATTPTPRATRCTAGASRGSRLLRSATLTPRTFRAGSAPRGGRLRVRLRARAVLCLTVQRRAAGGGWREVQGSIVRRLPRGTSVLHISGRLAGRLLGPGRHRLTIVATAGTRRETTRVAFRIVR